ncbi:hypothetical protein [Photorhabdus heterorhabditis]|uniref:hypothetical protein n=1 Tax=Photorhabdus heterorhabditis TaxID=880156 RepID=UPI0015621DC8|nr:hypothetical protein [Photorhabdus heterorhabditis]NRN27499.1 hypothetical protein [Photorhabdus heterorhabditis subsp. aluminescens]
MGLTELKNKLAAIVPETDFKLDERSTLDILNWLQEYAKNIPFDQEKKQFWDSFYFIQENSPEKLADLYQNVNKANGRLPAHQAFVLAFLKLLETTKVLFNTFPARHRDLYYRELLGLKPRNAQADSVSLGITLNTDNAEYLIPKGTLFDAGQDSAGNPLHYASDTDLLANQGKLTDLRWCRKDHDSWQSAILLNHSDNIELPENGIRLFSPTPDDVPVLSGYLITSPLFAMSKGKRVIKITLANEWTGNLDHITAKISSGDHWLSLSVEKESAENIYYLKLHLSTNDDPVSPPDTLDNIEFDVPVLKLGTIQGPVLPKITDIEISINGNSHVRYSSDDGIEKTEATSFPFGHSPSPGSGFNLIAPEWYGTESAKLTLTPQWTGLPKEGFKKWYQGYSSTPENNAFKVQAYLITPQKREEFNEAQSLFSESSDKQPQGKSLTFTLPTMDYPVADSPSSNNWSASIRLELTEQDFMHAQYWQNPTGKNQPYTPKISALQIQFSAKVKPEQFSVYPLTPFGWGKANTEIPSLINDTFYLGFTNVLPGQTLSLCWQLEGSRKLPLSWFYLNKNNNWSPLDKLIDDKTRNLFDRGTWRTLLPHDASNQTSQMPKGRYWLKAQTLPIRHLLTKTNKGKLTDLYWYRKDNGSWQSAMPLNLSNGIKLPTNGIQIFSPTSNDVPILPGYLITASLFAMPAGERTIKATLESEWTSDLAHITAQISSGDHWLSLSVKKEKVDNTHYLTFYLSANDDPISPPDALDNMAFEDPVLKLTTIQGSILPKITGIEININRNHNILYASESLDKQIEQTGTTIFPFGQSPSIGSSFNLAVPKWYGSENTALTITPQWVNLPTENFSTWYEKYNPKPENNSVFKVKGYLFNSYSESQLSESQLNEGHVQALFDGDERPQGKNLNFTLPEIDYDYYDNASVRIKLVEQDFMHTQYKQDATSKNPPYTPQISALQVQFNAKIKTRHFSVYLLTPFGWDNQGSSLTHEEFYLGFTGVSSEDTLSLYWQLQGTKKPALSWSYLSYRNTWEPLEPSQSSSNEEVWSALLPWQASNKASQMPAGRHWLKAVLNEEQGTPIKVINKAEPLDYPQIKGLLYNATTTTLINAETVEQEHFINGLTANNIKQPVNASVAINDVTQPWASWNGRPKETEQGFLTRVSARLSHRNRVLSWKDIVTLLKENFINLFDVKYPSASELTKIPAPEKRQLIIIPDNRYKDNDDSLRPELNQARLSEMVEWSDRLSSPWTTIEIKNPTYVNVLIHYELIFAPDVNPDYGLHQLQQELSRKYMPWGENTAIGITPGNRIDYFQLLATIQQLPLVERVTNLTLTKGNQPTVNESIEAADDEVLILVW